MIKLLLFVVFIYYITATTVFAFRHPWMTNTENFLHLKTALTFGKIEFSDTMRGKFADKKEKVKDWFNNLKQQN